MGADPIFSLFEPEKGFLPPPSKASGKISNEALMLFCYSTIRASSPFFFCNRSHSMAEKIPVTGIKEPEEESVTLIYSKKKGFLHTGARLIPDASLLRNL